MPRYLRVSIANWSVDLYSQEAEHIFRQIDTDGVAVFRAQPGFVRYRLMRANRATTVAVAEWNLSNLARPVRSSIARGCAGRGSWIDSLCRPTPGTLWLNPSLIKALHPTALGRRG